MPETADPPGATAAAIRHLHWRRPPFLIARAFGHRRLHAVILGFGADTPAIIDDLLLSSLTGFLGRPRLTILDPAALAIRARLLARSPALADSADFAFLAVPAAPAAADLPVALSPVTLVHAATPALADAMRHHPEAPSFGAIFVPAAMPAPAPDAAPPVLGYGDAPSRSSLVEGDPDAFAQLFHAAYCRTARADAPANRPWEALPEQYRESNRRLLMHLPAKLATAGVDVARWLRSPLPAANEAGGIPLPDIEGNRPLMDRLAELEHRRWMADRQIGGWRPGPARDDAALIHPDLKPWAELPEATKNLDRAIVREAWATLGSATGTGFFPDGGGLGRRRPATVA